MCPGRPYQNIGVWFVDIVNSVQYYIKVYEKIRYQDEMKEEIAAGNNIPVSNLRFSCTQPLYETGAKYESKVVPFDQAVKTIR